MASRRVLITGASKGIGRAVARAGCRRPGNIPIGLARTRPAGLPRRVPRGRPRRPRGHRRGSRASRRERADRCRRQQRRLRRFGRIGSIDLDDLFETYDLNVRTAVQVVQAVLPGMLAARWGRIVNVTSLTTLGTPERTPYAASKAALETCTRIWANELASTGITVNAVAPGPIETEMYRERSPIGSEREARFLENHSAAPGRYAAGDRACDLRAARRGRRLHHRSDPSGRRRWKHRRMSSGAMPSIGLPR